MCDKINQYYFGIFFFFFQLTKIKKDNKNLIKFLFIHKTKSDNQLNIVFLNMIIDIDTTTFLRTTKRKHY